MKYLVASVFALPLLMSCVDDPYYHRDYYVAPPRAEVHRHYPDAHYHPHQRYYNQAPRMYHGHAPVARAEVQQYAHPPVARAQVQQHGHPPVVRPPVQQHGHPSVSGNGAVHVKPNQPQPRTMPPRHANLKEEGQGNVHGH